MLPNEQNDIYWTSVELIINDESEFLLHIYEVCSKISKHYTKRNI